MVVLPRHRRRPTCPRVHALRTCIEFGQRGICCLLCLRVSKFLLNLIASETGQPYRLSRDGRRRRNTTSAQQFNDGQTHKWASALDRTRLVNNSHVIESSGNGRSPSPHQRHSVSNVGEGGMPTRGADINNLPKCDVTSVCHFAPQQSAFFSEIVCNSVCPSRHSFFRRPWHSRSSSTLTTPLGLFIICASPYRYLKSILGISTENCYTLAHMRRWILHPV